MARLGQTANPTSWTALYTVPASSTAENLQLNVTNRSGGSLKFSVAVDVGGDGNPDSGGGAEDYEHYETAIASTDAYLESFGSLDAGDIVWVKGDLTGLTFCLRGEVRTS